MKFNPKISIIIPVYNGGDYLREAVDSALAQTYRNIEILVVNDGSDDGGETERIALSYGNNIRYINKSNGGVASALNAAILEMSGEYFSWLSHDDLYAKEKIERQMNALSSINQEDIIIYSDYSVFVDSHMDSTPVRLKGVRPEEFRYWITVENALHGCTLLIPRSAFHRCGCFNEDLRTTQDYDLWFRLAKEFRFIHIPEVLVSARSHANQGSNRMAGVALAECNKLLTGFVRDLTAEDLRTQLEKGSLDIYSIIAASMYQRGFEEAGRLADNLASQNDARVSRNGINAMRRRILRLRDYCIKSSRNALSPQVRRRVKGILSYLRTNINRNRPPSGDDLKSKFSEIYDNNTFGGRVSRSGEGSDLVQTATIRRELPRIVEQFKVKSFLDAPCGDWCWMREVELGVERYVGVDIVDAMIARHNLEFGNDSRLFRSLNLADAVLPTVDMVFSRDCLVHLTFEDALRIIRNFKRSGSKYLLTTTFVDRRRNNDLIDDDSFWRALNMQLAPFNFPEPILVVNEGCSEEGGQYPDKSLGLWLLSEINC